VTKSQLNNYEIVIPAIALPAIALATAGAGIHGVDPEMNSG